MSCSQAGAEVTDRLRWALTSVRWQIHGRLKLPTVEEIFRKSRKVVAPKKKNASYRRSATVCFQISGKWMIDEEVRWRKIEWGKKSWKTKISRCSRSAGAETGSACLLAQFVGSQTGTRNACLTGDSSGLKRLRKEAGLFVEQKLSYRHIMLSHDGSAEEQEFTRARLGRGHLLQRRSYGKQATAASHMPVPQPRECAHDQV